MRDSDENGRWEPPPPMSGWEMILGIVILVAILWGAYELGWGVAGYF